MLIQKSEALLPTLPFFLSKSLPRAHAPQSSKSHRLASCADRTSSGDAGLRPAIFETRKSQDEAKTMNVSRVNAVRAA